MWKTKNEGLGLAWKAWNAHTQTSHRGREGTVSTVDPDIIDIAEGGMTRLYFNSPKLETQISTLDGMDADIVDTHTIGMKMNELQMRQISRSR